MVVSALERLRKKSHYNNHLYVETGKLYCRFCNHTINHEKQSIVDNHIESAKHKAAEQKQKNNPQPLQSSLLSFTNNDRDKINIAIALKYVWLPVSGVDVERSFSIYKSILTDKRTALKEDSIKKLNFMYFNFSDELH